CNDTPQKHHSPLSVAPSYNTTKPINTKSPIDLLVYSLALDLPLIQKVQSIH
ncbi:MAG: hypothetical protein ACI9JZ_003034, partial [Lentimonas sp.]